MAVYAIGDVQGCYSSLCRLLDYIKFDDSVDKLWFCGDLVNRGNESLETLRFVKGLGDSAVTVLGNHDLHLLALHHGGKVLRKKDTLFAVLNSKDADELMAWLQARPLLHRDKALSKVMVHAGIHPDWPISQALNYAAEVEQVLQGSDCRSFLAKMYGNQPDQWRDDLSGMARLRCITNVFTRLRFLTSDGRIELHAKGGPSKHQSLSPWFELNSRQNETADIVFGHWSTLATGRYGKHFATDGGCVWGGKLVALRIDLKEPQWVSIDCPKSSK